MAVFSFNSAEAQTAIVGKNNPSVDIQAIQKAVDQGGTVTLKGTFNFGNEGRVNITKDVKIVGETDNSGNPDNEDNRRTLDFPQSFTLKITTRGSRPQDYHPGHTF